MLSEQSSDVKFEIGHVLFIDVVSYSKLLITEQSDQLQTLKQIVRGTEQFRLAKSEGFLLPRVGGRFALFQTLREKLADFAKRVGCGDPNPISPHRLRHTWASELLRCGISLPALMQLMGHADIQTTLVYVQVTPQDVYLQYTRAVANRVHHPPVIPL